MALDLFKRVETRKGLFAGEKITLIYDLLTSILILFLFQEMDHPVQMLADRAVIAGMTFLLMYLYRLAPCKFSAFIRIVIQMSLLSYWYPDTFEFNRIFPNLDHVFASVEQWIFGGQPAVWFCLRFPQMWVSEPFNMGYFFYYPMILLVVFSLGVGLVLSAITVKFRDIMHLYTENPKEPVWPLFFHGLGKS